jgi:hypothetical protein
MLAAGLGLLLTAACLAEGEKPKLAGGFVQYWNPMVAGDARLTRSQWDALRAAMKAVGVRTVILQHHVWHDARSGPQSLIVKQSGSRGLVDPTEIFLADPDLDVYLGLTEYAKELWGPGKPFTGPKMIQREIEVNKRVIARLYDAYLVGGTRKSFQGWYIPMEAWNHKEEELSRSLHRLYQELAAAAKNVTPRAKVAASIYFNPDDPQFAAPAEMRERYETVLTGTCLDILILQDGCGKRGETVVHPKVPEFFEQVSKACHTAGVTLWGAVECFQGDGQSASPARFEAQLKTVFPYVKATVAWDFFHYMSPYRYRGGVALGAFDGRQSLYDGYKRYWERGVMPGRPPSVRGAANWPRSPWVRGP